MDTLCRILSFDFILRNSVYTSVLIGFACPFVGVFLVLRRLVFIGVALPQISSTGVAVALTAPLWMSVRVTQQSGHILAFLGAVVFALAAILVLAFLERLGHGVPEGRLGMLYVVAAAASILLLSKNPHGELGWLDVLKGEIITVSNFDLLMTFVLFACVLGLLGLFRKELLLVSYDRALAVTLRKSIVGWDIVLYLLVGLTVSVAVFSVGPLTAFGFLLVPALISHMVARNMRQLMIISSLLGGGAAFAGFVIAYRWDLPVGPTDVALLGIVYGIVFAAQKAIGVIRVSVNCRLK